MAALAAPAPEVSLDAACPPALALLRLTTAVLELGERVAAGDLSAAAEVEELAGLVAPR